MKHRTSFATIAVVAIAALAVAGCGSSNKNSSNSTGSSSSSSAYGGGSTSTSASGGAATSGTVVVKTATVNNKDIGTKPVLVNAKGFTLYDFEADKGGKSACNGQCAQVWPPLTGKPKAQGAAVASKLGTIKRDDGSSQVTYAGHPLYTYTADKKPGDAVGNDSKAFGATWYALQPSGENASS